jgi:hypothetical protein
LPLLQTHHRAIRTQILLTRTARARHVPEAGSVTYFLLRNGYAVRREFVPMERFEGFASTCSRGAAGARRFNP